jgi:hypothetical protein
MTMRPDPTFHASPKLAMKAPPEDFAYTLLLSNGRQFPLLIEDGADRGGIVFGDDKHPPSMVRSTMACKRDVRCFHA